jgi:hypothetical protein
LGDNLVTCIVSRRKKSWEVMWISDLETPKDFKADGLSESLDRASREIGAIYSGTEAATETELQFAIYPFNDNASLILDVQPDGDGFSASDLDGAGLNVRGKDMESLVEAASSLPNSDNSMFRWIRPMKDLVGL